MKSCTSEGISSQDGVKPSLRQIKEEQFIKMAVKQPLDHIILILKIKLKDPVLARPTSPLLSFIHVKFAGNHFAITSI